MTRLSIPSIEALPGFEKIDDIAVDGGRLKFRIVGKSPTFGSAAANKFVELGLVAIVDGRESHLYRPDVSHHTDGYHCTVACDMPRFIDKGKE
ncbi:hypothetical protein RQP54_18165 [Curvibacter sp. APW13]|uniref:hypothetical protein n=1 Tax=Curvibacter sp. APW13 TaxID=3077236 RepID=UPI0028E00FB8|nr:hypothetical protein [Curvibacter sp. APW13]MDT8992804.1 hypothetical protein [Curvibacter sp. APW13]